MEKVDTRFLNGTRFLLALWVATGHFYSYVGGTEILNIPLISKLLLNNASAVDGFMIITGFLMMYHYIKREEIEPANNPKTIFKFWTRRFFRLYPVYLIAIVLAFLTYPFFSRKLRDIYFFFTGQVVKSDNAIIFGKPIPDSVDLLEHLTFLHGLMPVNTNLLGPAWSLSLEMQFYLVFPLIFLAFFAQKRSNVMFSVALLSVSIGLAVVSPKVLGLWNSPGALLSFEAPSLLTFKLHLFVFGMICARIVLKNKNWKLVILYTAMMLPFENILTGLFLIIFVILLFTDDASNRMSKVIGYPIRWVKAVLSSRIATLGADISYSFYLIHVISFPFLVGAVVELAQAYQLSKFQALAISFVGFLVINTLVSYALYRFIEQPFILIGKRVVSKLYRAKYISPMPQAEAKGLR